MRTRRDGGVRAARSSRGGLQRRIVDHAHRRRRPARRARARRELHSNADRATSSPIPASKAAAFTAAGPRAEALPHRYRRAQAHSGTYSALSGTTKKPEVNGTAGVCQTSDGSDRRDADALGVRRHQRHDQIRRSRSRRAEHERHGANESLQRSDNDRRLGRAHVQPERAMPGRRCSCTSASRATATRATTSTNTSTTYSVSGGTRTARRRRRAPTARRPPDPPHVADR